MRRLPSVMVILCVSGIGAPAVAKDLNGRMGVGGATTALHPGGLSIRYFFGLVGVQAILSHEYQSPEGEDNNTSTFLGETRVLFNAALAKDVNLFAGAGIGLGAFSVEKEPDTCEDSPTPGICDSTEVSFEGAIGAEYFFSNHFSVSAEVGLPVRLVPKTGGVFPGPAGEGTYISLFRHVDWGAAFSFLF